MTNKDEGFCLTYNNDTDLNILEPVHTTQNVEYLNSVMYPPMHQS